MKYSIALLLSMSLLSFPLHAEDEDPSIVGGNAAIAKNETGSTFDGESEDDRRTSGSGISQNQVGLANAQTVSPLSKASINIAIAVNKGTVKIKSKTQARTSGSGISQNQVGLANAQTAK